MGILRDLNNSGLTSGEITSAVKLGDQYLPIVPGTNVSMTSGQGGTTVSAAHPTPTFLDTFLGIVTDAGPDGSANLTRDKYWVKRSVPVQADADGDHQSAVVSPDEPGKDQTGKYVTPFIVSATNLAETNRNHTEAGISVDEAGNHSVPKGTVVRVFSVWDRRPTARPIKQYFFYHSTGFFPCLVAQTGGSNGTSASDSATYTYTVKSLHGDQIGTAIAVVGPRMKGAVTAGSSYGVAFWDNGTLKLWSAGEVSGGTTCP